MNPYSPPPDPGKSSSANLLALDGPIAAVLDNFSPRPSQQQMAALVEQAMSASRNMVIEVPSGAGKTLAYLVPIIAGGQKAVISTASRYLQDQLFRQDIPLVKKALGSSVKVAVLKGRSNYLCPYYLEKHLTSGQTLKANIHRQLIRLWQRYRATGVGEISELSAGVDKSLLPYASCSNEDCLAEQCPQLIRCPLMIARQRAQQAHIVVVNHSLLFSDRLMRKEQLGGILPSVDTVVIDEAHRLADFAQTLVGNRLSSTQLSRFCRDATVALQSHAPEQRQALDFLKQLQQAIKQLTVSGPSLQRYQPQQHRELVEQLIAGLKRLVGWFNSVAERDFSLTEMLIRARLLQQSLNTMLASSGLCFIEPRVHGFVIQNIPLDVSARIAELLGDSRGSWIFTSATLSVAGSADRFMRSLGLDGTDFQRLKSDISYQRHARLYLPSIGVDPDHQDYINQVTAAVSQAIERVNGRVLFLFTSYKNLYQAAEKLRKVADYPVLVQGDVGDSLIIEQFKRATKGVLLGTGSFWEGLDLSGVPLSMVVIDKLPFPSPHKPLINLRSNELARHGVDSFQHYLLADAVIRLRQGCGRLLRRLSDKGVIMLADPRLQSKSYGAVFIDSLPAIERLTSLDKLADFFDNPPH